MELQSGALLQGGKYKIEKTLGQGGFGVTYLAEQTNLKRLVCIKEFFMKEYGERTSDSEATVMTEATAVTAITTGAAEIMGRYRERFIKEAQTIAKLNHPGIVKIHDVFEENGTAYYVMDYIEGENLNDLVKREGALPEERAIGYLRQVGEALSYVHGKRMMHLDVKPSNILVSKTDDRALLIDFGTAKQYDSSGTQTSATPVGISAGYAAIELMSPGGVQTFSPETDVYSLGATLYYLVTGKNPPNASERMDMLLAGERLPYPAGLSTEVADAIEKAMQGRRQRPESVESFIGLLQADVQQPQPQPRPQPQPPAQVRQQPLARRDAPSSSKKWKILLGSAAGIVCLVVLAIILFGNKDKRQESPEAIDLGLSVKWALCNLGASGPDGNGSYFTWDEAISAEVPAGMRLPTKSEFEELVRNCSFSWTSKNGVKGYQFTGRNGNSIFLPAAGHFNKSGVPKYNVGDYWSSTKASSEKSSRLTFGETSEPKMYDCYDNYRQSVRLVSD